jgi:hypothetical protein
MHQQPVSLWTVGTVLVLWSCGGAIPPAVKIYAAELPARADGQYALLDDSIKKQLVMKDALLQCEIDVAEGSTEAASAGCACARSSSEDWVSDCKSWLGAHAPAAEGSPAPAAPPTPPVPPS